MMKVTFTISAEESGIQGIILRARLPFHSRFLYTWVHVGTGQTSRGDGANVLSSNAKVPSRGRPHLGNGRLPAPARPVVGCQPFARKVRQTSAFCIANSPNLGNVSSRYPYCLLAASPIFIKRLR